MINKLTLRRFCAIKARIFCASKRKRWLIYLVIYVCVILTVTICLWGPQWYSQRYERFGNFHGLQYILFESNQNQTCDYDPIKTALRVNTSHIEWTWQAPLLQKYADFGKWSRILTENHCPSHTNVTLLIVVPSGLSTGDAQMRNAIRSTWGHQKRLQDNYQAALRFFVGFLKYNTTSILSESLLSEAQLYHDIVALELPLQDQYSNLALKILTILHWTKKRCKFSYHVNESGLQYVVKADQDSFWNMAVLRRSLAYSLPYSKLPMILGNVQYNASVIRDISNPWRTSFSEFSAATYPTYVTGGPGYILNAASIFQLLNVAEGKAIFWLEDVFLTGILAADANVFHVHSNRIAYCKPLPLTRERYEDISAAHYITMSDMKELWSSMSLFQSDLHNSLVRTRISTQLN